MNFVERFKLRTVLPQTVKVKVGSIEFEIARMSTEEQSAASDLRDAKLRSQGLDPDSDSEAMTQGKIAAYCVCLATIIQKHVKGWEIEGESIPFNQTNLKLMMGEMTSNEKFELGLGYLNAVDELHKKKEAES